VKRPTFGCPAVDPRNNNRNASPKTCRLPTPAYHHGRKLTIEETYELADELLKEDLDGIKEEIGDLLLHMVFYAKIASEQGAWDIADALNTVCDKLVERHPHIYGDVVADDAEAVKRNWEQIKLKAGKGKKTVLSRLGQCRPGVGQSQGRSRRVSYRR